MPSPIALTALPLVVLCLIVFPAKTTATDEPLRDTQPDTWVLPAASESPPGVGEAPAPRADRYVGIFYFLWMTDRPGQRVLDLTKLVAENPGNPRWGRPGEFHWWGEPHLGYYTSNDEAVIRRHAQMLSDAGVDVVFFDVTNGLTYDDALRTLCRVYDRMRREGNRTPQVAFLANSRHADVVNHLYKTFYAPRLHEALWFRWQGKPLILSSADGLGGEVKAFFTFRRSWAWTDRSGWFGEGRDKWPWLDHHPQTPGWHERPDAAEQISVSVAQHPTSNIGRSFHGGKQPAEPRPAEGLCFVEQWERALAVDPQFVFVTGWNEWIAQRFIRKPGEAPGEMMGRPLRAGETFFVDLFSQEYSRDIEPMAGGHGDAYYYQLARNVRRFKGARPAPEASARVTIDLGGPFAQWAAVKPEFLDDLHDTTHRDHPGYGDAGRYVNRTGRNDLDAMKVARDDDHVYFYARTREVVSPAGGADEPWMTLLIDSDEDGSTGWNGFDLAVNRRRDAQGRAVVERYAGPGPFRSVDATALVVRGRELHLSIPRAVLAPGKAAGPLRFRFKWLDNVRLPDDPPIRWIDTGDVAPNGRFAYRYAAPPIDAARDVVPGGPGGTR